MDQASAGARALDAKDFQSAIDCYTKALATHSKAVDYYIKRSTAYARLSPPNNLLSLLDAETAVVLARDRGKRELIGQAQLRRGVALFGSERYADAGQCFEWAKKLLPKDNSLSMWLARVESKRKDLAEDDDRADIRVKEIPEVDMDGVMKKAAVSLDESAQPKPLSESTNEKVAPTSTQDSSTPAHKIRHDWYQTADTVTVTLMAKGVDKEKASVEIQSGLFSISFPLSTGSDFDFSIDPLYAAVDPSASSFKIMSTKVEIVLKKRQVGHKWHALEGASPVPTEEKVDSIKPTIPPSGSSASPNTSGPAYPTSSKHGPKNWDKLATDLTKKPEKDGKEASVDYDSDDGGDPVNAFFKKLYKDATPETRRAMIKSYQESNGTALSTNWDEVSKGPVETSPPEGMEVKKW